MQAEITMTNVVTRAGALDLLAGLGDSLTIQCRVFEPNEFTRNRARQ